MRKCKGECCFKEGWQEGLLFPQAKFKGSGAEVCLKCSNNSVCGRRKKER
jgi:hypothetical protein